MKIKRFLNLENDTSGGLPQFQKLKTLLNNPNNVDSLYQSALTTSLGSIVGNVTAIVFNHYLSQFPKGYFKTSYISTQLRSRDIMELNTDDIASIKKIKPIVYFRPQLSTEDVEGGLNVPQDLWTSNLYLINRPANAYQTMFYDGNNCMLVNMGWRYLKMDAKMSMIFHTMMEQYDTYGFARNQLMYKAPYYLYDQNIEVEIPLTVIKAISTAVNISYLNDSNSFIETLQTFCTVPVAKKLNTGTGTYSYFMIVKTNILIKLENINPNEGEEVGQVMDNFTVDFDLYYQFNYPTAFYITSNLNMSTEDINYYFADGMNPNEEVLPEMTVLTNVIFDPTLSSNNNFAFYSAEELRVTAQDGQEDITPFESVINKNDMNDLQLISNNNETTVGKVASQIYSIVLATYNQSMKESSFLAEGTDYIVNWDNFTITILSTNRLINYVFALYRNNVEVTAMLEQISSNVQNSYE